MKITLNGNSDLEITLNDVLTSLKENITLEDFYCLKDYQERKYSLTDGIDAFSVEDICKRILQYNSDDKELAPDERKPVILYLDTLGGDVTEGLRLIDVIRASVTPVYVVNLGTCYSMGFWIYIAGHKRIASKNATFLIHDGSTSVCDSASKTRDYIAFFERVDDRLKEMAISLTKIPSDVYDQNMRKEWYMFSDEAKELGVVDAIIGVDCGINEIV